MPIKQKWWEIDPKRAKGLIDEVDELLGLGGIKKVKYPDWIEKAIVVKKKNANVESTSTSPT